MAERTPVAVNLAISGSLVSVDFLPESARITTYTVKYTAKR
jgi:hypothetical protein